MGDTYVLPQAVAGLSCSVAVHLSYSHNAASPSGAVSCMQQQQQPQQD